MECQSGDITTMSKRGVALVTSCTSMTKQNEESRTQLCLVAAMDREQEEMVQTCDTCQLHNKSPPAAPLHPGSGRKSRGLASTSIMLDRFSARCSL